VAFPTEFDVNKGVPLEVLNKIYNAADCLLTTTLGEGWGFINTEAMAVKRPILAPNNTAITEILGIDGEDISLEALNNNYSKWRGVPLPCGTTSSEFVCQGVVDNERLRPLTNVDEAVKRLDWVYNSPARVKTMVDNAYEWIKGKDWDIVCQDWVSLFDKAYQGVLEVRKLGHRKIGGERNDICPICDVKFKKCPHGK
jgi:glycosyltransferase involved in cell wall biosynthesis